MATNPNNLTDAQVKQGYSTIPGAYDPVTGALKSSETTPATLPRVTPSATTPTTGTIPGANNSPAPVTEVSRTPNVDGSYTINYSNGSTGYAPNTSKSGSNAPDANLPIYKGELVNGYAPVAGYSNSAPGLNPPTETASDYLAGGDFTPPPSEDEEYQKLLTQSQGEITDINKSFDDEIKSANAASAARTNASGLAGSSAGGTIYNEAQQPIIDARNTALDQIYSQIQTNAQNFSQQLAETATTNAENAVAYQKQLKADALATATDQVKSLAANHFDINAAANPSSPNYGTYQSLLTSVGGDPNVLAAMFAQSAPPETVISNYFTPDGNGGTTVNQVVQDPVTGKISHQNYNIAGINIPNNWTPYKLGTNATRFESPNYNPQDPSTYSDVSVDPTNNGAITVTSNGVTTVNGIPINNNPSSTSSAGNGTTTAPAAPVVANLIGITDPTVPLSSVIGNVNIGVDGIVNGIIANEGGSPKGVINNPGNIKFNNLPGQTNSGVTATDGGTFASYSTKQDGIQAIGSLVQKASDTGESFDTFINKYTGTGQSAPSNKPYDVNSGLAPTDDQSSQMYVTPTGVNTGATNEDIYQAGVEYATTGKAPSLGNGSSGAVKAIKIAVQNAASGYAKSLGTTYPKLQEEFAFANSVPTQTMIANSNTVINSISDPSNGLIALSDKVPRGNVQIKNGAAIAVSQGLSDPATVNFVNKVNSTADELGKIFGSGAGSDFTTQLAQSLINPNLSQDAFKSSMQTILGSVQNKVDAYLEQAGGTIGGSTNNGSSDSTSTPNANDIQQIQSSGFTVNGSNATAPDGTQYIFQNGGWVPATQSSTISPSDKTIGFLQENGINIKDLEDSQIKQLNDSLG